MGSFKLILKTEENNGSTAKTFKIVMLTMLVCCHVPRIILSSYEIFSHLILNEESKHIENTWSLDFSHTLLILGSSFNSLVVLCLNKNFLKNYFTELILNNLEQKN